MSETSNLNSKAKKILLEINRLFDRLNSLADSSDRVERTALTNEIVKNIDRFSQELRSRAFQNKIDIFIDNVLIPKAKAALLAIWGFILRNITKALAFLAVAAMVFFLILTIQAKANKSHGLFGSYYQGTQFDVLVNRQLDKKINFEWRFWSPVGDLAPRNFSIRWEGFVKTDQPGTHYFFTLSDDGVRLWIDDQLLIDDWRVHAPTINHAGISLNPGFHKIELEYFQGVGGNRIKLSWQQPKDEKTSVLAPTYLYPYLPENAVLADSSVKLGGATMGDTLRAKLKDDAEKAAKEKEKERLELEKKKDKKKN